MPIRWAAVLVAVLAGCPEAVPLRPPDEVRVEPEWVQLALGESAQLRAEAVWRDGRSRDVTDEASWRSANEEMVVVDAGGLVTGVGRGPTRVEASFDGMIGRTAVIVDAAVATCVVLPEEIELPAGQTHILEVEARFDDGSNGDLSEEARWESSDESVAAINLRSVVAGCPGTATIRGWVGEQACEPATVTVTDGTCHEVSITGADAELEVGDHDSVRARCTMADGSVVDVSGDVTWSSSDPDVAEVRVDPAGHPRLEPLAPGSAEIVATYEQECVPPLTSPPVEVTVVRRFEGVVLAPRGAELHGLGETLQYEVTCEYSHGGDEDCTAEASWEVEDPFVAAVSAEPGSEGLATALGVSTTHVTATAREHISNSALLRVFY